MRGRPQHDRGDQLTGEKDKEEMLELTRAVGRRGPAEKRLGTGAVSIPVGQGTETGGTSKAGRDKRTRTRSDRSYQEAEC